MYGIITSLVTLLWLAAYTLLADPGATLPSNASSAPAGCASGHVCGDDAPVVATSPLDR